jgi:hypothetical protein
MVDMRATASSSRERSGTILARAKEQGIPVSERDRIPYER